MSEIITDSKGSFAEMSLISKENLEDAQKSTAIVTIADVVNYDETKDNFEDTIVMIKDKKNYCEASWPLCGQGGFAAASLSEASRDARTRSRRGHDPFEVKENLVRTFNTIADVENYDETKEDEIENSDSEFEKINDDEDLIEEITIEEKEIDDEIKEENDEVKDDDKYPPGFAGASQPPLAAGELCSLEGFALNKGEYKDEIWKNVTIPGFEHYLVSSYSRIKCSNGKFRKITKDNRVSLRKGNNKIEKSVYHISLLAFVGPPPNDNKYTADHINKDYNDHHISNLRWATISLQNLNRDYGIRRGNVIIYTKNNIEKQFASINEAAKEYNIERHSLSKKLKINQSYEYDNGIFSINNPKPVNIKEIPDWIYRDESIPDEKFYVSENGFVKTTNIWKVGSLVRRKELKQYYGVSINKKPYMVHALIAAAFLGKPPRDEKGQLYIVNHKDNDGLNNNIDNLEYTSLSGNIKHAISLGLCVLQPVLQYDLEGTFLREFTSIKEAKRLYNAAHCHIGDICRGRHGSKVWANSQWRFKTSNNYPLKIEPSDKDTTKDKKKVNQYDLQGNYIQSYESMRAASRAMNCSFNAIRSACIGETKTSCNYKWKVDA